MYLRKFFPETKKMKIFAVLLLAASAIAIGILFATHPTQGQKKGEATYVERGKTTEAERAYSKEYRQLYSYHTGRKFSEMIEEANSLGKTTEDLGASFGDPGSFFLPDSPEESTERFLKRLICASDVVVLGSPKSKASHMTDDETFIYTSYEFHVRDVIKVNASIDIGSNETIEITRPGGLILLDGRRIIIEDRTYAPLKLNSTYLLFLKYVPSAQGYMAVNQEGDFTLEKGGLLKLTKKLIPEELEKRVRAEDFLNRLRNARSRDCTESSIGGK